jgi:hypothetical protein
MHKGINNYSVPSYFQYPNDKIISSFILIVCTEAKQMKGTMPQHHLKKIFADVVLAETNWFVQIKSM